MRKLCVLLLTLMLVPMLSGCALFSFLTSMTNGQRDAEATLSGIFQSTYEQDEYDRQKEAFDSENIGSQLLSKGGYILGGVADNFLGTDLKSKTKYGKLKNQEKMAEKEKAASENPIGAAMTLTKNPYMIGGAVCIVIMLFFLLSKLGRKNTTVVQIVAPTEQPQVSTKGGMKL